MKPLKRPKKDSPAVAVRFTPGIYAKLAKQAKLEDRPLAAIARRHIEKSLEQEARV